MGTHDCDVAIVGAGLVGLSFARALAGTDLTLALVEPNAPGAPRTEGWDNRVYAVSPGSAAFLERCGAWQHLAPDRITRVESMRVYGDADSGLEFTAYDAGVRELAWIVEARALQQGLREAMRGQDIREYCPANWTELAIEPEAAALRLENGTVLKAKLVVGADGADSRVRAAIGIGVATHEYDQLGVVANFYCERPHRGTAFQWFLRDGVLALLPLPGSRVSMVWSTAQQRGRDLLAAPAAQLALEVESASRGALGSLELLAPGAAFPLRRQRVTQFTRPRVALAGDAAHNVHPLAGQGVNLGFRDARVLADVLARRGPRHDCGEHALLRRYERARAEDVAAMRFTTDGLQKLFMNDSVWLTRARNLGLALVDRQPLIKSFLVHHAVM
jgi:ubiquinone biosynthesis UbiH/UbiF/VisC/COQ6 family hydroxylase